MKKLFTLLFSLIIINSAFSQWFEQVSGTTANLKSISFVNENNGWVVGSGGNILKTTNGGDLWTLQISGTTSKLNAVSFIDDNNGLIVGDGGLILKTTNGGSAWIQQTSGTMQNIRSVSYITLNAATAVANGGLILNTNDGGNTWSIEISTYIPNLFTVFSVDPNTAYASGYWGRTLKTTDGGTNWSQTGSTGGESIYGSYFLDTNNGFVVDSIGKIFKTINGGGSWSWLPSGVSTWLRGVDFTDNSTGTVVGDQATILRTTNGGWNWQLQESVQPDSIPYTHYNGVSFVDNYTGWVVGDGGKIFKTINGGVTYEPPELLTPSNGSVNLPTTIWFTWNYVFGATSYRIQLSDDQNFQNIVVDQAGLTDSTTEISGLEYSTTYFWRMKSYFPMGESDWSEGWSFNTQLIPPPAPQLLLPTGGTISQTLSINFSWLEAPTATNYRLQVSVDSLFGSFVFNQLTTQTNRTVNLTIQNQKYYWRVQASNNAGAGLFSEIWNLFTFLPPPTITSLNPTNKQVEVNWTTGTIPNIDSFFVFGDILPNPTTLIATVPNNQLQYLDTGLTNGQTYYYRIKALSSFGFESNYSNQASAVPFNAPPVAVVLQDYFLPDEGRLLTKELSFSSAGSYDPDGTVDSVRWYVNDEYISDEPNITQYFSQGTNYVSLIVIDNEGGRDTSIANVTRSMFRNYVNGQVVAGLSLIGDNILYAIVNNDAIYKMDTDGNVDYTLSVGGNLLSSSSIANDSSLYIGSTDNNIYAFSKNGVSLWVRALGGAVTTTPTIDLINDRVYVGVSNRNFQFLDRATGSVLGNYFSDAPINTSAVITADNKLFFSTVKGTMYGFDLGNISFPNVTPTWIINSTDTISSSPAIDELGYFYVGTKNGLLKKISMEAGQQGTVIWQANLGGEIIASPVIDAAGNIYVGSSNNDFFCVDRADGDIKWSYTFGGQVKTAAAISDESRIYFGTENGFVYCVDTTGTTLWQYKDSTSICNSLLYSDGVLYLGTYGGRIVAIYDNEVTDGAVMTNNIWSTFQGNNQRTGEQADRTTDVKRDESGLPVSFKLSQNYPNPFNPTTKIKFDLPQSSTVDLKVYNVLGQLITTLVNEEKPAGFYEVDFNAADLPSGVYMYRIQAGDYVAVNKMILIK